MGWSVRTEKYLFGIKAEEVYDLSFGQIQKRSRKLNLMRMKPQEDIVMS